MGKKQSEFVGVEDAARLLDVSGRQVRNLIKTGALPAQMIGGGYVISRKDLAKVPKDRKPGPKPKGH